MISAGLRECTMSCSVFAVTILASGLAAFVVALRNGAELSLRSGR